MLASLSLKFPGLSASQRSVLCRHAVSRRCLSPGEDAVRIKGTEVVAVVVDSPTAREPGLADQNFLTC